jgi:hypothetical protein
VLYGLAVARELRRTVAERRQWHRLGVDPVSVGTAVLGPIAAATVVGLLVAGFAGWLFDPGPMGLVSAVEPHAGRRLTGVAVGAVAAVSALALFLAVVLVARAVRRPERFEIGLTGVERPRRVPIPIGSPVVSESVRAAYGQRAAPPVLAGIMLLTASLTAALVFGASLERLLDNSRSYGWPWDVAAMAGAGYGDLDVDRLEAELGNHPAVADWTVLGFVNELALDGDPLMSMIMYDGMSDVDVTVRDGELPRHADEIAIGELTAAERGLSVGDTVEVGIYSERRPATITGLVVFPALGPMLSDRVGGGSGMALPQAFFETPELAWLTADAMSLTSFVGVKTLTDDPAVIRQIEERLVTLDLQGGPAATYTAPIRPAEIIDAGSTRNVPITLAVVLAIVGAVGVAFAAWASIRARRKELSVLRTLGFSDRQVRGSVLLQSIATMLAALAVGGPVGVIGGRLLWRAFADQLGVLPDPASPTRPVLIAVAGGIAAACLAAQLPAVLATRALPAQGLRTE